VIKSAGDFFFIAADPGGIGSAFHRAEESGDEKLLIS